MFPACAGTNLLARLRPLAMPLSLNLSGTSVHRRLDPLMNDRPVLELSRPRRCAAHSRLIGRSCSLAPLDRTGWVGQRLCFTKFNYTTWFAPAHIRNGLRACTREAESASVRVPPCRFKDLRAGASPFFSPPGPDLLLFFLRHTYSYGRHVGSRCSKPALRNHYHGDHG